VTEISGRKVLVDAPSDARTEVVVYRLGPVHVRTGTCEHCGGTFPAFRSQKARRFCSRECDQARRALARLRTCPRCATRFDPKHHTQKYCTPACKRADHSVDATCVECGNQYRRWLSHARQSVDACTPQCRQAYWSKHSAKNSQGTCAACGGSTSKKTYTRCRPCVMSGRQIVRTAPQDVAPPGRVVLTIRELP
jgi:hypothetical protein